MKSEVCCFIFIELMSSPAASNSQNLLKVSAIRYLPLLHCSIVTKLDTKNGLANQWVRERSVLDTASCVTLKYISLL